MNYLEKVLHGHIYTQCSEFVETVKESRHLKALERQTIKFERLCKKHRDGCSNHTGSNPKKNANIRSSGTMHTSLTAVATSTTDMWIKNLSIWGVHHSCGAGMP